MRLEQKPIDYPTGILSDLSYTLGTCANASSVPHS